MGVRQGVGHCPSNSKDIWFNMLRNDLIISNWPLQLQAFSNASVFTYIKYVNI